MQNLAYGSSDDEDAPRAPVASGSKRNTQPCVDPSTAPPALNTAIDRVKAAATLSRSQSPLAGVKLSSAPPLSSAKAGKRRESSVSPPRYERAAERPSAEREEEASGWTGPAAAETATEGEQQQLQQLLGVRLDALAEFGIPPVPTGPGKPSVEAKLANFHKLRQSRGLHFNDSLHASKAFRNPRIYAKLVEFVDVDETGTNWSKEVWDPKDIGVDATASRIAELQKLRSEAKAAQPAGSRSSIAFASSSSTSNAPRNRDDGSSASGRHRDDRDRANERERDRDRGGEKKKSRWDRDVRDRSRSPRRR